MVHFHRWIIPAALVALSAGVIASDPKPETNEVALTILRDGKVVGMPGFVMRVGGSAMMTVAGVDGYSARVSLSRELRFAGGRKVDLELSFADGDQWRVAARPSMSLALNEPGRMSFSDAEGRKLDVQVIVRPHMHPPVRPE